MTYPDSLSNDEELSTNDELSTNTDFTDSDITKYKDAIDQAFSSNPIAPDIDYKNDSQYDFDTIEKSDHTIKIKTRPMLLYIVDFISSIFFRIGIILIIFVFYITYISILILIFIFIASFIISYIMSPIFLSLANEAFNAAAAFLQVLLSSPLVVFMVYFLLKSIGKIEQFSKLFGFIFKMGKFPPSVIDAALEICNIRPGVNYSNKYYLAFYSLISIALGLFMTILGSGLVFIIAALSSGYIFGFFFFLPTAIEVILLLSFTIINYFRVIFFCKSRENSWITIFNKRIEDIQTDSDDSESDDAPKKANQATQTFENEHGKFNLKIGYSHKKYDKSTIQSLDSVQTVKTDAQKSTKNYIIFHRRNIRILISNDIIPFYQYCLTIERDRHYGKAKAILIWIFTILNLALISCDIYRLTQYYSSYFLASTILRFFLIPFFSYFHLITQFLYRPKNKLIRWIFHIATGATLIIAVALAFAAIFKSIYVSEVRIKHLQYSPPNPDAAYYNPHMLNHLTCTTSFYNVSLIDAYGYSLGGYDVVDNPSVFDNQMKTFFGENYSSHITYTVENVSGIFPFIIYHDSNINTSIVAFRGFNTSPELACLIDLFMSYYILPIIQDAIPFIDLLIDFYLKEPTKTAHKMGKMMFDPTYLFKDFADIIIDICMKHNLDKQERVVFTGIGVGGAFAKIAGIHLKKLSLGLLSLPITNDLTFDSFGIEEDEMIYVNTLFIPKSIFARAEPDFAANIGLFQLDFSDPPKFCTAEICQFTMKKESYYPILCTMAGLCGQNAQFGDYCKQILGDDLTDKIKESVMEI